MSDCLPPPVFDFGTEVPLLHLYAQAYHHGSAVIAGNAAGLRALRDAIDRALAGGVAPAPVMAGDAEGYRVIVAALSECEMEASPAPYTDTHCRHDGPWPDWLFARLRAAQPTTGLPPSHSEVLEYEKGRNR